MAMITLSKAVEFPIGTLRTLLSTHAPRFRWQCGDGDMRGEKEVVPFHLDQLIMGVGEPEVIMVTARQKMVPAPQHIAPHRHRFHIALTRPTTEDSQQALLVEVLIAAGLMLGQDDDALVQFKPGGAWLNNSDLEQALTAIKTGQSVNIVDRLGSIIPNAEQAVSVPSEDLSVAESAEINEPAVALVHAGHIAGAGFGAGSAGISNAAPLQRVANARPSSMAHAPNDRILATPPSYADEGVFLDRLPTLVVLLRQELNINWALLNEGLNRIDPDGNWSILCDPNGHGIISGNKGGIKLDFVPSPIRGRILPEAIERSYWFKGSRESIDDHSCQLTLTASIHTRSAPYEVVEKTARIMSLIVATICREPDAVAVYNAGVAIISDAFDVAEMINILADNELPIQLWTHVNWRSLEFESVSCFSSGFAPFLGYEIEVWDAPVSAKFVQVKMSDIMRYLLRRGPIIQSGDAFGVREDDRNIRCHFSDSRVDRKRPVFAMNIDFERGSELAASRPDRLSERRGAPSLSIAPGPGPAKVAKFGRKGL